jgi:TolA-binding protein
VRAEGARIEVRASRGTIHSVHVFAGSVEVVSGGKTVVVTAGATWEMPAAPATTTKSEIGTSPPAVPAPSAAAPHAARAFAAGWTALRANQPAAAVAAFQSAAADPDVGEDASYWLAIAHLRAGEAGAAIAAFEAFVVAYPASPHAGAAHLALVRLLGVTDPARAEAHRERATLDTDPRVREAATPGNPGLR